MKIQMWKAILLPALMVGFAAPVARAQTTPKIGVFDSKEVFESSAEGQRLQKLLSEKRDEYRASLSAKESEVRAIQQKLKEGEFTLSEDRKSGLQKELQRKMVELDSLKQEASNNMRIELDDVQSKLNKMLYTVIREMGEEEHYTLILEKNTQVVFASKVLDISSEVVKRFDAKYPPATKTASDK
ncbi:MAG: OmpH family outer membrane protein [Acidobacteriota bacterium]